MFGRSTASAIAAANYAAWLEQQQAPPTWQAELTQRRRWIEALKAGQNPFTPELLRELQQGVGE